MCVGEEVIPIKTQDTEEVPLVFRARKPEPTFAMVSTYDLLCILNDWPLEE